MNISNFASKCIQRRAQLAWLAQINPETGPMQFDGSHPGVYLNGDVAHFYATHLRGLIERNPDDATLLRLLSSILSSATFESSCQTMKTFPQCKIE